ncbi:unnamed protein product, partial [Vitis vinifera]|uniref:Uncharacterized protein n=1 Tax=Vitis vinifera TaxID=29760 RepID=D7SL65_VITVI
MFISLHHHLLHHLPHLITTNLHHHHLPHPLHPTTSLHLHLLHHHHLHTITKRSAISTCFISLVDRKVINKRRSHMFFGDTLTTS